MFEIDTNFIGNFKIGDNVKENVELLGMLYRARRRAPADDKKMLTKPIVIWIGAITETVLRDFLFRARSFHREGVRNIPTQRLVHLRARGSKDKFKDYIAASKEIHIFGKPNSQIYKDLDELRELRNRIHLNVLTPGSKTATEVFGVLKMTFAEKVLEEVLRTLSTSYTRGGRDYVGGFTLPWNPHFGDDDI